MIIATNRNDANELFFFKASTDQIPPAGIRLEEDRGGRYTQDGEVIDTPFAAKDGSWIMKRGGRYINVIQLVQQDTGASLGAVRKMLRQLIAASETEEPGGDEVTITITRGGKSTTITLDGRA
ncbi:hypothetical protein FLP41_15190 [Paracoccus marcusii]|uniref:hypothetical protein n=1 Tax=Paracoccus marcusii TaxID=59779 RepID=UPI002ED19B87|nr:hypothetical protein FLP41_15190 [Paracoccus marcusii]